MRDCKALAPAIDSSDRQKEVCGGFRDSGQADEMESERLPQAESTLPTCAQATADADPTWLTRQASARTKRCDHHPEPEHKQHI